MPSRGWDDITGRALGLLALSGRRADLFRRGLTLLLLLLVAQAAAKLTWALVEDAVPAAETPVLGLQGNGPWHPPAAEKPSPTPGEKIAGVHLFGQAAPTVGGGRTSAVPLDVPVTTLDLMLKGVIAATPMKKALAIISEKGKEDAVYGLGGKLPGKALVKAIYPDRVILLRAGRLETLFLEEPGSGKKSPSTADSDHRQINRSYLDRKLANLPELASEVGVRVVSHNGRQYGYRLVSSRGSKFLDNLGLKAGDILYEVNGIRLSSASQAMTAYEKLRNAPEIWLELERNGQRETRTYTIR